MRCESHSPTLTLTSAGYCHTANSPEENPRPELNPSELSIAPHAHGPWGSVYENRDVLRFCGLVLDSESGAYRSFRSALHSGPDLQHTDKPGCVARRARRENGHFDEGRWELAPFSVVVATSGPVLPARRDPPRWPCRPVKLPRGARLLLRPRWRSRGSWG